MPVSRARLLRFTGLFLAISYGLAAPLTAWAEFAGSALSERFGYPAAFIYLVCAVQVVCALGVLRRSLAPLAAAVLTVITLGALVSHLMIGSPLTSLPAIAYSAIQVWFGLASRGEREH